MQLPVCSGRGDAGPPVGSVAPVDLAGEVFAAAADVVVSADVSASVAVDVAVDVAAVGAAWRENASACSFIFTCSAP